MADNILEYGSASYRWLTSRATQASVGAASRWTQASLEVEPQRKLQVAFAPAHSSSLGKHFPKGIQIGGVQTDICGAAAATPAAPIRMVDEVESLGTELEAKALGDRKRFEQAEVPILEPRLIDQITYALLVERTGPRFREDRSTVRIRSSKPLAVRPKFSDDLGVSIHDPILPVHSTSKVGVESHTGVIGGPCDAAWEPSLELRQTADLPSSQQLAGQRAVVLEEGQVVEIVEHQDVARVEL
jgi:hypothetical protein